MEFDWKKVKVFQVVKRNCVSGITSGWRAKAVRHLNVEKSCSTFAMSNPDDWGLQSPY